jgi:redox-sensing transcriptional repressor
MLNKPLYRILSGVIPLIVFTAILCGEVTGHADTGPKSPCGSPTFPPYPEVSSAQLATKCMVNAPLLRKDLSYFGKIGVRGVGYYVKDLLYDIKQILGLSKEWRMAVIGIGNLGSSLLSYKDFLKQDYQIVAAFDIDPPKVIGRVSGELGKPVEVLHIDRIKEVAKERKIEIGIITTPPSEAQHVADMLVEAGVRGILNFAPRRLQSLKDMW